MLKPAGSSPLNFIKINRPGAPSELAPESAKVANPEAPGDSVEIRSSNVAQSKKVSSDPRPTVVEGELMVKTKGSLFKSEQDNLLESLGASVKERFEFPEDLFKSFDGQVLRLQLPDGLSTKDALAKLADDPRVEYAVPNEIIYLDEVTDDGQPAQGQGGVDGRPPDGRKPDDLDTKLWGLHNNGQDGGTVDADIDAPEAWLKTTGSNDVVVAVIDTGVDYNHPDLKDNIWTNPGEIPGDGIDNDGNGVIDDIHGYNAFADNGDPMDGHSHGTHCSGTIAGQGNNGQGVAGVAWDAKIMGVKIFADNGSTTSDAILRGILYAAKNGARITSNSWGGGGANQAIKEAFEKSTAFHVMAAGNDGRDVDRRENYPSGYEMSNSISVAATDRNDKLASFSNYGVKEVDLGAPGVQTYSTIPNGRYGFKSGTSMATPHVSGAAVMMVAHNPGITNEELKAGLMNGGDKIASLRGKTVSGGRLNIANSLENDKIAPGEIRDFKSKALSAGSIGVSFLASGDDGYNGTASSYEVRVSEQPIQTLEQFLQATPYDVSKPSEAGTKESMTINVAPSTQEREMHVAVRAFDNLSNASPFAHQTITMPTADLAYAEPVELDTKGWTTEGSWGIETPQGRVVFSDSPGELSRSQANDSITSPTVDLAKFQGSALMFDTEFKLEQEFDQVHLEAAKVAAEGAEQSWVELATYTGTASKTDEVVDLSAFDGEQVQFRFRLTTDQSYTEDGFNFDNVRILGQKTADETIA
jgi:subtilisin family serine protease